VRERERVRDVASAQHMGIRRHLYPSVQATQCMHAHVHVPEHASSMQATQKTLPNIANGLGVHAVLFRQGVTSGPKKIRI